MNGDSAKEAKIRRKGARFDYQHDCTLFHNGVKYACMTQNMSISGVMLSSKESLPASLARGDTCGLSLSPDSLQGSGETSKVVRIDDRTVALNFLGFNY